MTALYQLKICITPTPRKMHQVLPTTCLYTNQNAYTLHVISTVIWKLKHLWRSLAVT